MIHTVDLSNEKLWGGEMYYQESVLVLWNPWSEQIVRSLYDGRNEKKVKIHEVGFLHDLRDLCIYLCVLYEDVVKRRWVETKTPYGDHFR